VFRRRDFFQGRPLFGSSVRDIVWLQPDGSEMTAQAWGQGHARALAVFLSGDGLNEVDAQARAVHDDSFLLLFNAHSEGVVFTLPEGLAADAGELLVDTRAALTPDHVHIDPARPYTLPGRALALFRFAHAAPVHA
jgi:glycogen operon protein